MKNENITTTENKDKKKGILGDIISIVIIFFISLLITQFFRIAVVNGHSMDATLYDSQHLLLSKQAYAFSNPEKDDIIVAEPANLGGEYIVKRVIGVAGDNLRIENNQLYINDVLIEEPYILEEMVTEDLEVDVPEGKIFVMGDNRNNSGDSRSPVIGLIDIETELLGKVVIQFPF